jgi:UDP-glucose 4-epimerase
MAIQLVTGGAGFIGSHIATELVERGKSVRVFDNLSTGKSSNISHLEGQIEFVKADLLDRSAVENALKDVEVIYHQAALASVPRSVARPFDSHAHCVTTTVNLLDVARQSGVRRVIFAGSSSVYGDKPFSSKRESDLPAPISPYAAAKAACENYCRAFTATYGLETVVLRYFNVFGPRQDPKSEYAAVIPKFVMSIMADKQPTIFGDGLQSRDFTFVSNVVAANFAAADAENAGGRVFNAACGQQFTLLALIDSINRILGKEIKPLFSDPRTGDVRESLADITAARKILGYSPSVGFEEGLKRSIEYYKSLTARE